MARAVKTITPPIAAEPVNKMLPVVVVLSTLLFVALCATGYFYYQYRQSPQVTDAKEIAKLTETIGAFFTLPEGETPTLATVTDKEKLADQPFFQKAENGDKVLIYSQSGRAILYRPGTKKIVDVTTVNVNTPPSATAQASAPAPAVLGETTNNETTGVTTIALYNGSKQVGITNTLEAKITAGMQGVTVSKKEKATKDDYTGILVVDVSGKHADLAQSLANLIGGRVASLPDGEPTSGTDLLVIAGNATQ